MVLCTIFRRPRSFEVGGENTRLSLGCSDADGKMPSDPDAVGIVDGRSLTSVLLAASNRRFWANCCLARSIVGFGAVEMGGSEVVSGAWV